MGISSSWGFGGTRIIWSLVVGHWSLVVGHWSLVVGHSSLVFGPTVGSHTRRDQRPTTNDQRPTTNAYSEFTFHRVRWRRCGAQPFGGSRGGAPDRARRLQIPKP